MLSLFQKDFYVFGANAGWTQIAPQSTNNPPPRQQDMAVWDSKDKVSILVLVTANRQHLE